MSYYEDYIRNVLNENDIQKLSQISLGSNSFIFKGIVRPLESLRKILIAADESFEFVTNTTRREVDKSLETLRSLLRRMLEFNGMDIQDPGKAARDLYNSTSEIIDYTMQTLLPATAMRTSDLNLRRYELDFEALQDQYKNIVETAQIKQAEIATDEGSTFFNRQTRVYTNLSALYLYGMVASLLLVGAFSYRWSTKNWVPDLSASDRFAKDLPFLNFLAIGWFAIRFFARNFRNSQHLKVFNDTKVSILRTGLMLSTSISDPKIQSMAMEAVINTTLTVGDTAYLGKDGDAPVVQDPALISLIKSLVIKP